MVEKKFCDVCGTEISSDLDSRPKKGYSLQIYNEKTEMEELSWDLCEIHFVRVHAALKALQEKGHAR